MKLVPFLLSIAVLTGGSPAICSPDAPLTLSVTQEKVTAEFRRLDALLKHAAGTLGVTGLKGEPARKALRELCGSFESAFDCSAVDAAGRMVTVEPEPFRRFEGSDISKQEHFKRVRTSGKPVLSDAFRSVEWFDAAAAQYPVTSADGRFMGSVSILFSPAGLLERIVYPLTEGTPLAMRAVEKGGHVLYDTNVSLIGMNLFTSRQYQNNKSFADVVGRIIAEPEGYRAYPSNDRNAQPDVSKKVFWRSVSLYGTEWRLVCVHVEREQSGKEAGNSGSTAALERKLETLAAESPFIAALAKSDERRALEHFRNFYGGVPGIYSIQWMDEKGINRFGYPVENSLTSYDYHTSGARNDGEMLKILDAGKPATMEAPLFEGGTGVFTFRPVFSGQRYLGMVYMLRIKRAVPGAARP